MSGSLVAEQTVRITPRNVKKRIEFVGHAPVRDRVTSDLWVWEGVDGRDYAVHGTWNADGHAYFYDVTDPRLVKILERAAGQQFAPFQRPPTALGPVANTDTTLLP